MKNEISIEQPDYLIEDWPGKFESFSWLEYVVNIPNPIFIVTTRKENGAANANLQSWGLLIGDKGNYTSLLALLNHSHTYANILREGEWCLNYPSVQHYQACFETIQHNHETNDEICDAGFCSEPALTVQAPRIAECALSLECRLEWEHPLYPGNRWHLFAGRVTHVAMDEAVLAATPEERMRALNLMYNIRSTINPLTGEYYGPNTLGLIGEVVRVFDDQGRPKWERK